MSKKRLFKKKLSAQQQGETLLLATTMYDSGKSYYLSKNWEESLKAYTASFQAYAVLEDKLKCVVVRRIIGELNATLGKYECAIKHLNLSVEGAKELGNEVEVQQGFATLGRTYFLFAQTYPEKNENRAQLLVIAEKFYNKSIEVCNGRLEGIMREKLLTMRARLLLNQGLVKEAQMHKEDGINLVEAAIKIFAANKVSDELHRAHMTLAALYEKHGKNIEVLKILDGAANNENKSRMADALLAKAQLFLKNGEWLNARKVLVKLYPVKDTSEPLRKEIEKLLRIAVTLCRGDDQLNSKNIEVNHLELYEKLGDTAVAARCYNRALKYYEKMLSYAERDKSKEKISAALVSLVQTYKDAGRYKEALPFAKKELQMSSDPRETCKTALLLAELLESAGSTSAEIINMYNMALSKVEISQEPSLEVSVLKNYLSYLDIHKTQMKTRLDRLLNETPVVESEKEAPYTSNIGADIYLDELSDLEFAEAEKNRDKPGRKRSASSRQRKYIRKNQFGETQLHSACRTGNVEKVRELLKDGYSTDDRDNLGWTPLQEAAENGGVEIVQLLINAGANVDDAGGPECEGLTPLHDAAQWVNISVVNFLIEKGANIHAMSTDGYSILDVLEGWRKRVKHLSPAVEHEYKYVRSKLSANGVKRRKENKRADTPVPEANGDRNKSDAPED